MKLSPETQHLIDCYQRSDTAYLSQAEVAKIAEDILELQQRIKSVIAELNIPYPNNRTILAILNGDCTTR
jgi:predicted transcriptional regulator